REAHVPLVTHGRLCRAGAVAPVARGGRGAGQSPRQEREAARAGASPVRTRQRLHRDPDPTLRRSLAAALLCSAVLVVGLLVLVGLRVQQVHLAYQLDALRAERARITVLVRQLEIE